MTKQEFENMACATVTAEEYKIIEKVYTWHPGNPEHGRQKPDCNNLPGRRNGCYSGYGGNG